MPGHGELAAGVSGGGDAQLLAPRSRMLGMEGVALCRQPPRLERVLGPTTAVAHPTMLGQPAEAQGGSTESPSPTAAEMGHSMRNYQDCDSEIKQQGGKRFQSGKL
ncbi:UNVERIFIED_CONTAM: hypothetical protein K2H54_049822 [Gekko kuhli]